MLGCVLGRSLREALERLQEHHETRRRGRVRVAEQRVDEEGSGDRDEKAGEELGADGE